MCYSVKSATGQGPPLARDFGNRKVGEAAAGWGVANPPPKEKDLKDYNTSSKPLDTLREYTDAAVLAGEDVTRVLRERYSFDDAIAIILNAVGHGDIARESITRIRVPDEAVSLERACRFAGVALRTNTNNADRIEVSFNPKADKPVWESYVRKQDLFWARISEIVSDMSGRPWLPRKDFRSIFVASVASSKQIAGELSSVGEVARKFGLDPDNAGLKLTRDESLEVIKRILHKNESSARVADTCVWEKVKAGLLSAGVVWKQGRRSANESEFGEYRGWLLVFPGNRPTRVNLGKVARQQ